MRKFILLAWLGAFLAASPSLAGFFEYKTKSEITEMVVSPTLTNDSKFNDIFTGEHGTLDGGSDYNKNYGLAGPDGTYTVCNSGLEVKPLAFVPFVKIAQDDNDSAWSGNLFAGVGGGISLSKITNSVAAAPTDKTPQAKIAFNDQKTHIDFSLSLAFIFNGQVTSSSNPPMSTGFGIGIDDNQYMVMPAWQSGSGKFFILVSTSILSPK